MSAIDRLSAEELRTLRTVSLVIAEAIQSLGEVPEGELYANVQQHMGLVTFQAIVATLVSTGLVERSGSHTLRYVGRNR